MSTSAPGRCSTCVADPRSARRRRADAVGPLPLRGSRAGGSDRRRRRLLGGLHLQVPQRRPRLTRLRPGWPRSTRTGSSSPSPGGWATRSRSRWATSSLRPPAPQDGVGHPAGARAVRARRRAVVFDGVEVDELREVSLSLTDYFVRLVDDRFGATFEVVTPREHEPTRQPGVPAASRGVRRGPGADRARRRRRLPHPRRRPFRLRAVVRQHADVLEAVDRLVAVMAGEEHLRPEYATRNLVT